jgi:hypothetical protein
VYRANSAAADATEHLGARCSKQDVQEDAMHLMRLSLSAALLLAGLGYAAAQQEKAGDAGQQQRHEQMLQTMPGKNAKEEPSSHLPNTTDADAAVLLNGKLNVPGAPQDGQTVPAKYSEHNAEIDALPTMALPLALTDEQKQRIAASVAKGDAPVAAIDAKPADMLPVTTPAAELPQDVAGIPALNALKVVRTKDKVLLVNTNNMVVRGVIAN